MIDYDRLFAQNTLYPVFPFKLGGGSYEEGPTRAGSQGRGSDGSKSWLAMQDVDEFAVDGATCVLPQQGNARRWSDLVAFWENRDGPAFPLLYLARQAAHRVLLESWTATAGQARFPLSRKWVADHADHLVVKVNGGPTLTPGTPAVPNDCYIFNMGTQQAELVLSTPVALNDNVTLESLFLHEMQFAMERLAPRMNTGSKNLSAQGTSVVGVSLMETAPGASLTSQASPVFVP